MTIINIDGSFEEFEFIFNASTILHELEDTSKSSIICFLCAINLDNLLLIDCINTENLMMW